MWWKIEIVFSYLTGMGMLWLENCEKLLLTFFYRFIWKYLCCSIQLASASSPLELVPELRISAQEIPHPWQGRMGGSVCSGFICSVLFCFIAGPVSFRHFCSSYWEAQQLLIVNIKTLLRLCFWCRVSKHTPADSVAIAAALADWSRSTI